MSKDIYGNTGTQKSIYGSILTFENTINEFSTDGTFADNSDTALPTEKAAKTYIGTTVAAADEWLYNATGNEAGGPLTYVKNTGSAAGFDTLQSEAGGSAINITDNININSTTEIAGVLDEDDMATDSATNLATQQSIKAYTDTFFNDMQDPNGFIDTTSQTSTFTDGSLTWEINPTGANYSFYSASVKYTVSVLKDIIISNTEGTHIIYFGGDTLLSIDNPTSAQILDVLVNRCLVGWVYWDATNATAIYDTGDNEYHGINMSGQTHAFLHNALGAQYISGAAITVTDTSGDGTADTHAQFGVATGSLRDEDLTTSLTAVVSTAGNPIFHRAGGNWRKRTMANFGVYTFDGTNGTRLAFDNAGTLTQCTDNYFVIYHVFGINDTDNQYLSIMGQAEYSTRNAARNAIPDEINNLVVAGLPFAEMIPIGSIIFQTKQTYSNGVKAKSVQDADGNDYVDFRGAGITPSIGPTNHNALAGLVNDDHLQYWLGAGRTGETLYADVLQGITHNNAIDFNSADRINITCANGGAFRIGPNRTAEDSTLELRRGATADVNTLRFNTASTTLWSLQNLGTSNDLTLTNGNTSTVNLSVDYSLDTITGSQMIINPTLATDGLIINGNASNGDSILALNRTATTDEAKVLFNEGSTNEWGIIVNGNDDFEIYNNEAGITSNTMTITDTNSLIQFFGQVVMKNERNGNKHQIQGTTATGGNASFQLTKTDTGDISSITWRDTFTSNDDWTLSTPNNDTLRLRSDSAIDTFVITQAGNITWIGDHVINPPLATTGLIINGNATNEDAIMTLNKTLAADVGKLEFQTATVAQWNIESNADNTLRIYDEVNDGTALLFTQDATEPTVTLHLGTAINEFSVDGTLAGDSDDAVPTEKAVKLYVDTVVGGGGATGNFHNVTIQPADITTALEILGDSGGNTKLFLNKTADGNTTQFRFLSNSLVKYDITHNAANHLLFDYNSVTALKIDSSSGITLKNGVSINEFSSDDTLAGDSDDAVPTEQAVKAYVDTVVGGGGATGAFDHIIIAPAGTDKALIINPDTNGTVQIDLNKQADSDISVIQFLINSGSTHEYTITHEGVTGNFLFTEVGVGNIMTFDGQTVALTNGTSVNEFSIDGTLGGNSDDAVPTEKAVKFYVDDHIGSNGSSHTYINQNVTTTGTPTFGNMIINPTTTTIGITINGNATNKDALITLNKTLAADVSKLEFQTATFPKWNIESNADDNLRIYDEVDDEIAILFTAHATDPTITLNNGTDINEFSTDGTLAGDSDDAVPTEKAVKNYVDSVANTDGLSTTSSPTFNDLNVSSALGADLLIQSTSVNFSSNLRFKSNAGAEWTMYMQSGTAGAHFKLDNSSTSNNVLAFDRTNDYFYLPEIIAGNHTISSAQDLEIAADGQVGYVSSNRASKMNIRDLNNTSWLHDLKTVEFNYRKKDKDRNYTNEPEPMLDYGLIAEDVEKINDLLVTKHNGKLTGVRYKKLITPILREVQRLNKVVEKKDEMIDVLRRQVIVINKRLDLLEKL